MRRIPAAAALMALSAALSAAGAQAPPTQGAPPAPAPAVTDTGGVTLRGIVRDTAGRPLVGAQVMTAEATAITEADGRFELRDLRADTLHLLIRRIGHQPASITLAPDRGVIVEFAATLVPTVVELGTIVVEGRTLDRRLWTAGYYDRAALGHGTYLGPEELGRHSSLATALRMVPSVRMSRAPDGRAMAFGPTGTGVCPLDVHVDGVLVRWANEVGLETLVGPGEVQAVEVYARASQVPAMLRTVGGVAGTGGVPNATGVANDGPVDCGALLVWTKGPGAL
jgi:hypothetical protein